MQENQLDWEKWNLQYIYHKRGIWILCLTLVLSVLGCMAGGVGIVVGGPCAMIATFPMYVMNITMYLDLQEDIE